jgi:hypothetical protein
VGARDSTASIYDVRLTASEREHLLMLTRGQMSSASIRQLQIQRLGGGKIVACGHALGSGVLVEDVDACTIWCELVVRLLADGRNW